MKRKKAIKTDEDNEDKEFQKDEDTEFEKGLNRILSNKKKNKLILSKSESKELEKLAERFEKNFKIIKIEGISVYGCNSYPKIYLGTLDEYCRYKLLNHKKISQKRVYKRNKANTEEIPEYQDDED